MLTRHGVRRAVVMLVLVAAGSSACRADPVESPRPSLPQPFVFVRDDIDVFPPGQRTKAEDELRAIAEKTGVHGVVVTADEIPDPPVVLRPIFEEVAGRGGQLLVGFCTRDACDLRSARAVSETLQGAVDSVAPTQEPAVGNRRISPTRSLQAWVDFVAAVAEAAR